MPVGRSVGNWTSYSMFRRNILSGPRNWPTTVAFHVLHVVFSALNLDVNFVQPQCVVGWDYASGQGGYCEREIDRR